MKKCNCFLTLQCFVAGIFADVFLQHTGYQRFSSTSGFAKLGGKVVAQGVGRYEKTAGDNPNGVQLNPQRQSRRDVICKHEATVHTRTKLTMNEKNEIKILFLCRY